MMSQELLYLFGSVVILLVLIAVQASSTILVNGLKWGFSARDVPAREDAFSGRAKRALNNHIEGLLLFGFSILMIEVSDLNSSLTTMGGALYFWARLAYAPVYLIGIPVLRTLIWAVSLIGILIELYVIAVTGF
ncbi:MAPEG family protein [Henriciella aquimarina]|uniref:MAPEG family protein n=1 Tax=Henriciella aquimarina TaxID=545261 RepID=UPI000A00B2C6|nr:MAPEG family protein [Henriciella aquimarina]